MSQFSDALLGEAPRDGKFHIRVGTEELQKMEGTLLRAAFIAAALAVTAMYVSDTYEAPAQPAAETKRVLPAPLL